MRIHITSFFFGSRTINQPATAGWGSNIGNINADPDKYEYSKYHGLSEIVNGMNKNDKSNDIAYLYFEKMSKNRDILQFSIFNKVFVNNKLIPDASYILAIVKENTPSHPGRISLTYPGYYKYSRDGNQVHNQETLSLIKKEIKCQEGCWFVYDVSVRNDVELHFRAKVVSKIFKEYDSAKERRVHWKSLVYDLIDFVEKPSNDIDIPEETDKQAVESKKASITGDKAEKIFEKKALKKYGWDVENVTDRVGKGYDFFCKDPELYIEIKGCRGSLDSIRLTSNEWKVAKEKKGKYILIIVYNIDEKDNEKMITIIDPFSSFNHVVDPQVMIVKNYHIKGRYLRELI